MFFRNMTLANWKHRLKKNSYYILLKNDTQTQGQCDLYGKGATGMCALSTEKSNRVLNLLHES